MVAAALVGVFGACGALLRFAADSFFAHHARGNRHWPWATLLVNVCGSFVIGLAAALVNRAGLSHDWQLALASGLAGGLTTFSSWVVATVRLWEERRFTAAAMNILVNLVLGLGAAGLGLTALG